jgi:hypothetical protein
MSASKTMLTGCILLFLAFHLWSESRFTILLDDSGIVENFRIREQQVETMARPVREFKPEKREFPFDGSRGKVRFQAVLENGAIYYIFVNSVGNKYPEAARGTYLIKRNIHSGRFEYIKIFYRDETACYIKITPQNRQARLDVLLFGKTIYHDLVVPVSLESLVTAPLIDVIEMTSGVVDWNSLVYRGGREEDRSIEKVIAKIRAELPRVKEAADGALDSDGKFKRIANGQRLVPATGFNCSGFAKWIVDGFYRPLTGRLTDISLMKVKHPESRGNRWSEIREADHDPYFGLDWTRNLACALAGAQTGRDPGNAESLDVRQVPFFTYTEDIGYAVPDLLHILYFLALKEPGNIYLGTVNDISQPQPVLAEYFHVAVFLPFFDVSGDFHVVVFDQHKEATLESFITRSAYDKKYIHLVHLSALTDFSLFHIE